MSGPNTEQSEQSKPEYKAKAHLVLEGSDKHEWGVVKDCHGNVNYIPEDAEVVGTWVKYAEGVFWVSLQTSLQALSDKATQLFKELAEKRKLEVTMMPQRRKAKIAEVKTSPMDSLRDKLKGMTS